jgi:hypothetical protein
MELLSLGGKEEEDDDEDATDAWVGGLMMTPVK